MQQLEAPPLNVVGACGDALVTPGQWVEVTVEINSVASAAVAQTATKNIGDVLRNPNLPTTGAQVRSSVLRQHAWPAAAPWLACAGQSGRRNPLVLPLLQARWTATVKTADANACLNAAASTVEQGVQRSVVCRPMSRTSATVPTAPLLSSVADALLMPPMHFSGGSASARPEAAQPQAA